MSVSRRVTSASSSQASTPRSNVPWTNIPAASEKTSFDIEQAQILFKTSSLALLRAKGKNGGKTRERPPDDPTYIAGASRVLKFMYKMFQDQQMCDVKIVMDGGEIQAHKVAIGAYSPVIAESFSSMEFGEPATIDLSDVPADTVIAVLDFIYTTDISINDTNVGSLLFCASELGIEILIKLCLEHLSKINPDNAMLYYSVVEQHGLDELRQKIYDYVCSNFLKIVQSSQFVHMPLEKLLHLLAADNLTIGNEIDIFLAIVRWVDHNRRDRLPMAPMLLGCVRFQLISPDQLATQVETVDWLFVARECFDILYRSMKFHALKLSGSQLVSNFPVEVARRPGQGLAPITPRKIEVAASSPIASKPRPPPLDLSAIVSPRPNLPTPQTPGFKDMWEGEKTPMNTNTFSYNQQVTPSYASPPTPQPRTSVPRPQARPSPASPFNKNQAVMTPLTRTEGHWFRTSLRLTPRANSSNEQMLVAIGGIDLQSIDPDVPGRFLHKLDPATHRWTALTTLRDYTHHHAVTCVSGKIFITGGCVYDYTRPDKLGVACRSVHVLDATTRSWHQPADMREARAYHASVSWKTHIYVIGGENASHKKLDSIEQFDPVTNKWTFMARMPSGPRVGIAAAVHNNNLFIVGGFNKALPGLPVVPDVSCFDLDAQRWVPKSPLRFPCCHAGLVEAGGRLYLIGGRTRTDDIINPAVISSLSTIHEYDPFSDEWAPVADMGMNRHDFGCTAIDSRIYIVGGMTGMTSVSLDLVECFDVDAGVWDDSVDQLPFPASGIACCAVPGE